MIPPNNFWWLSQSPSPPLPPPPHHMSSFSKQIWVVPLWILPNFSAIPTFGFSVTTDPQGINNDRSLMCLAVIMQHANMACHVQRAYKGPTIWLLRGGGGIGDLRKNTLKSDFKHKTSCKEIPAIQWLCMSGKNILLPGVWGKKILTQTHEITHTLVKVMWPGPNYM